jgi:transcriptional regulator with XRE-family HTH domain
MKKTLKTNRSKVRRNAAQETAIGELMYELRKRSGLTQEQCAAKMGVTFATINRWENGHAKPSPLARKQIESMAKELGTQGQDLLKALSGKA